MSYIEMRRAAVPLALLTAAMLVACAGQAPQSSQPVPATRPAPATRSAPAPAAVPAAASARNWDQYRLAAARRIVTANPGRTYDGPAPEVLLAVPVLEVELNADGSVRRIEVMRYPRQAKDTVPLAIEAVKRAAPFGDVSHLPKPWRFSETFLFNDDRKFKPRTLD